uniref:Putative tick til 20 n=1 Tax=Amblyomma triste TaxID=251400 RepID=A0A023G9X4_AMBTT
MNAVLVLLVAAVGVYATDSDDAERPVFPFRPDPQPCGTNEVWKQCVSGSCAETTCKKRTLGPACTEDCRYGCYCAEGFYRNDEGSCVTLDQCPPQEGGAEWPHRPCGTNEEWKVCVSRSCAEATCEKRTIGPECTFDCQQGCYCSQGFFRNSEGNCVAEDQCGSTAV